MGRIVKKDHNWRQKTIVEYSFLVKQICARFAVRLPSSVLFDDLLSAGSLGLIDAVDKFDPGRHTSLQTYARYRITGAIIDELRSMDTYSRSMRDKLKRIENTAFEVENKKRRPATDQEIADALAIPLEEYQDMLTRLHGAAILSLDEFLTSRTHKGGAKVRFEGGLKDDRTPDDNFLRKELKQILAKEINTLSEKEKLVISLYYYEELTLKEIGEVLSLTEARICQIHSSVLVKLKTKLQQLAA